MNTTNQTDPRTPSSAEVEAGHRFLCHSDGTPCLDGCDKDADPRMLAHYNASGSREREEHGATPGRYTFSGGFARGCTCGHTLGEHTGERITNPRTGRKEQPCLDAECTCACFKPKANPKNN